MTLLKSWSLCLLGFGLVSLILADPEIEQESVNSKEQRLLPIFNVVRFRNDPCVGNGAMNGTCFTAEECSNKDGTSSGTCADGFGVCCTFSAECGSTTAQNLTYLVQSGRTTSCAYRICRCNDDICRIRLDFNTLVLADPFLGTVVAASAAATNGGGIGDCITDSLTISGGSGPRTPAICGTSSGQHIYFDANTPCNDIDFNLSPGTTTTTRNWNVRVTQYQCGREDEAGPPGCLQYFTAATGMIQSFNFPTGTTVGASATHLSDQDYNICIRRQSGMCAVCYFPTINVAIPEVIAQNSFGLSGASAAIATGETDCINDYLEFFGATSLAIASNAMIAAAGTSRICGRFFGTADGATASETVCSRTDPFRVRFVTNRDEATSLANAMATETNLPPGGIIGFQLSYTQIPC